MENQNLVENFELDLTTDIPTNHINTCNRVESIAKGALKILSADHDYILEQIGRMEMLKFKENQNNEVIVQDYYDSDSDSSSDSD